MNLDRVAAEAFLDELRVIGMADVEPGTKAAAMSLFEAMDVVDVEAFLKEAGLGALIGGVGRGLGALGKGALQGAGSVAMGLGRGAAGAVKNTVGGAVQGVKNMASSAGQAIKGTVQSAAATARAAPGRLGQGMTNMGQNIQNKLTSMGAGLAQAGQAKGLAVQNKMVGPRNPQNAMNDIKMFQGANPRVGSPSAVEKGNALNKLDAGAPQREMAAKNMADIDKALGIGAGPTAPTPLRAAPRSTLEPPPPPPRGGGAGGLLQQLTPVVMGPGQAANDTGQSFFAPVGTPARRAATYGTVAPAM